MGAALVDAGEEDSDIFQTEENSELNMDFTNDEEREEDSGGEPMSDEAAFHDGQEAEDDDTSPLLLKSGSGTTYLRKSKRELKSRLINIDGHAVLRENNYQVIGMRYVYDTAETVAWTAKKPKLTLVKSKSESHIAKKPRIVSDIELKRQEQAKLVQQDKKMMIEKQERYLASRFDIVEPFVDEKVRSRLLKVRKTLRDNGGEVQLIEPKRVDLQPDLITGGELRDYQLDGLSWMAGMHERGCPMILGDEMGLGKTLQTISLMAHLREEQPGVWLIVCPLSVLYSWMNEFKRWAPELKVMRLHASDVTERTIQQQHFKEHAHEYDAVITTYDMSKSASLTSLWRRQYFRYLVLDEGHIIKNVDTLLSQAMRRIHFQSTLLLTGTPLQNNLTELWSLLNFMYPNIFCSSESFDEAFNLSLNQVNADTLRQAHKLLEVFMLRRLKDQVEKLIPKKIETQVLCPLSKCQLFWYKGLLMRDLSVLAEMDSSSGSSSSATASAGRHQVLTGLIAQLRKCCNHPFLFPDSEKDPNTTTVEELVAASGKLAVLDLLLCKLHSEGHRVVLFSQFTRALDVIQDYLDLRGFRFLRFDGSTSRIQRQVLIQRFNNPSSRDFLFLMSTRAGGMGINLQTADTCILFDSDWNPQPDIQAMARVHRIGQKKVVHVYRLISGGTVEERILERAQKKLYLDQMVNRGEASEGATDGVALTSEELLKTLKFGSDAVFGKDTSRHRLPTASEISQLVDRTRTEETTIGNLVGGQSQTTASFDHSTPLRSTTNLCGIDFSTIEGLKKKKGEKLSLSFLGHAWNAEQKRQVKQRIKMVDGVGSGYGSKMVPILASNDYTLLEGEPSVFEREQKGRWGGEKKKKNRRKFKNQDMCQFCGEWGGTLYLCEQCPVSAHPSCTRQVHTSRTMYICPQHRCTQCDRSRSAAGGLLFRCQACPNAYCDECLPTEEDGLRFLGRLDRYEELGYRSGKAACYIHCSTQCEEVAKTDLGWVEPVIGGASDPTPPPLDVAYAFGDMEDVLAKSLENREPVDGTGKPLILPEGSRRVKKERKPFTFGNKHQSNQTFNKQWNTQSSTTLKPTASAPAGVGHYRSAYSQGGSSSKKFLKTIDLHTRQDGVIITQGVFDGFDSNKKPAQISLHNTTTPTAYVYEKDLKRKRAVIDLANSDDDNEDDDDEDDIELGKELKEEGNRISTTPHIFPISSHPMASVVYSSPLLPAHAIHR